MMFETLGLELSDRRTDICYKSASGALLQLLVALPFRLNCHAVRQSWVCDAPCTDLCFPPALIVTFSSQDGKLVYL